MDALVDTGTIWTLPQVLNVLFSGVTMVGVFSAVWWLATTFATIKAKLEMLADTPARLAVLERDNAIMRKDIQSLWDAFREDCDEQHQLPAAFAQFLEDLDRRRPTEVDPTRRITP